MNVEIASRLTPRVTVEELLVACRADAIEDYNAAYYTPQRALDEAASRYDAEWDVRLGFRYSDLSLFSSQDSLDAAGRESPFTEFYRSTVIPEIAGFRPDVIGIGLACLQQMVPTLQFCRLLREAGCEAIIVVGGNTVSRIFDSLRIPELFQYVDAFAQYQGEPTVTALLRMLREGTGLAAVPNILWNDGGEIRQNPTDNQVDPDEMPGPNFDDLPLHEYWGETYLPAMAARGCYHGKCSFCSIPFGWGERRFAGVRNAELVYEDIVRAIDRYGIRNFKFVDDAMPPNVIRHLAKRLLDDGAEIQWEAYTRLEREWTDSDLPELAGAAGFVKGHFGVELVSDEHRQFLNKQDAAQPLDLIRRCRAAGILPHVFSMLGYPGTTADDAQRTIGFSLEHADLIDTLDIFAYGYARGTSAPAGVMVRKDPRLDWALEFPFESAYPGVLSSNEIDAMTQFYEEFVFDQCPRLLHPTYRLVSPWRWRDLAGNADVSAAAHTQD